MIRLARVKDIDDLLPLARKFVSESAWGFEYSEADSTNTFLAYIQNPDTDVLYVEGFKGFALVAYDQDFCTQRIGYISKFYIAPDARRTEAGRKLTEACTAWFDHHGCFLSFVTDTANIKQGHAFKNLMAKYGYRVCGDTLCRGKNEQV